MDRGELERTSELQAFQRLVERPRAVWVLLWLQRSSQGYTSRLSELILCTSDGPVTSAHLQK